MALSKSKRIGKAVKMSAAAQARKQRPADQDFLGAVAANLAAQFHLPQRLAAQRVQEIAISARQRPVPDSFGMAARSR